MPTVAVSPDGFVMSSMTDQIGVVFGNRSVGEVFGSVVELVSVEVSSNETSGSWAVKNQGDDVMNLEILFPAIVSVEDNAGVALGIDGGLEDSPVAPCSTDRKDFSLGVDAIVAETRYVYPLSITHGLSIHEHKSQGREGNS